MKIHCNICLFYTGGNKPELQAVPGKLTDSAHQTAIITTNKIISTPVTAGRMFGRWSQENFFRYMIMDYDFDRMIQFGTETINENKEVVNPCTGN